MGYRTRPPSGGREGGRKEGRKEGKKERRKEGRKGGREGGREGRKGHLSRTLGFCTQWNQPTRCRAHGAQCLKGHSEWEGKPWRTYGKTPFV
jgi:hypothetical protein